jgi:hypothetical protein
VVVEALKSLTHAVNLTTGLGHPSDKLAAIQMFKALKKVRENFVPDEVRAWAVRNGWRADHARALGDLAQKIQNGRTVRGGNRPFWRDNIIEIWRESASSKGD